MSTDHIAALLFFGSGIIAGLWLAMLVAVIRRYR